MGVGGGTGNTISFSEIRDFYGDTNPVSISDFNRNTSNDTLVDATFAGASTATTESGPGTKNDFGITQSSATVYTGSPGSLLGRANSQANGTLYTITADDALISLRGNHPSGASDETVSATFTITRNGSSVFSQSLSNGGNGSYASYIKGPVYNNGSGLSLSISFPNFQSQTGDVISVSNVQGNAGISSQRRAPQTIYDITFTNNNNTGDTYTLASSSTRLDSNDASQLVYSAGTSRKVKDDSSSNQWTIAYDNVSGSGPGTAGDIGVSETSAFTGDLENSTTVRASDSSTTNGQQVQVTYTVLASDAVLILVGGGLDNRPQDDPPEYVHAWNSTGLYNSGSIAGGQQRFLKGPAYQTGDYSNLSFANSNPLSTGNITLTSQSGTNSGFVRVSTARKAAQYTTVFTNNSGSKSYTLEGGTGKTTGGAATLAPGATRNAQTTNSSNSDWEVHFDTGSGNCNVGIPTTIGAGNPANIDLFNTVTTPIG